MNNFIFVETKPNNMTHTEIPFREINLESVRSKNYDANLERLGEHSNTCFICGKRTASDAYVHYTTDGNLTNNPEHADSQGLYSVGSECLKKLPTDFIYF